MAKPILVVEFPHNLSDEKLTAAKQNLYTELSEDYHLIFIRSIVNKVEFKCFNDCLGLPDDSIKRIIDKLNADNNSSETRPSSIFY